MRNITCSYSPFVMFQALVKSWRYLMRYINGVSRPEPNLSKGGASHARYRFGKCKHSRRIADLTPVLACCRKHVEQLLELLTASIEADR